MSFQFIGYVFAEVFDLADERQARTGKQIKPFSVFVAEIVLETRAEFQNLEIIAVRVAKNAELFVLQRKSGFKAYVIGEIIFEIRSGIDSEINMTVFAAERGASTCRCSRILASEQDSIREILRKSQTGKKQYFVEVVCVFIGK